MAIEIADFKIKGVKLWVDRATGINPDSVRIPNVKPPVSRMYRLFVASMAAVSNNSRTTLWPRKRAVGRDTEVLSQRLPPGRRHLGSLPSRQLQGCPSQLPSMQSPR